MDKQVFQTNDKSRWITFKWTLRLLAIVAGMLLAAVILMLIIDKVPAVPYHQNYQNIITANKPYLQETKISKEYKGFRNFIEEKEIHQNYTKERKEANLRRKLRENENLKSVSERMNKDWQKFPAGIRSAFYVAWDPQSLFSLKRNIRNLNLIIPEWFFIDPKGDSVKFNIDTVGYKFMRKSGVMIMPILSNNYDREFHPEGIGRILHNKQKRTKLINTVLNECEKRNFVGINIDLEDLKENSDMYLIQFLKEISYAFHQKGLLVTQDIMPDNSDYNLKELSKYNDYLILMAYDEYSSDSDPGPISSQRWVEENVDRFAKNVPINKIILGLGAYGYDWSDNGEETKNLTYQQALSLAHASSSQITFDNDTYNLSFSYKDLSNNQTHRVFFTDAATHFNILRFAAEYGLAGSALWRLGSEDYRMWSFYNKDVSSITPQNFNFKTFETVRTFNDVDYVGDGEVLNVLYTPQKGEIKLELDSTEMLISEEKYMKIPSSYEVEKYGESPDNYLALTFDDGPDATWTPQIINILSKHHAPAAFFVVGLQGEKNLPILKRLYKEGFDIGNHTFTHENIAKISPERAIIELKLTRLLIEAVTGHSTILFRAPYNADSEPATMEEIIPVAIARKENYLDIGENIDPEDWQVGISADTIFNRVVKAVNEKRGNIILLHDAGGETRKETIKATEMILDYFQKRGYKFVSLSDLLHKKRADLMPAIPKGKGYYIMQFNLALASIVYWLSNFFAALFIIFIVLGLARLITMIILMIRERKREKKFDYNAVKKLTEFPLVSIIVPAYNEEVNAVSSLNNLLKQTYPNYNIVFVDDGSKDETYKRVSEAFKGNEKMKIYSKPNGGKASALNFGIEHTNAEYVVCIDADTKLYSNVLELLVSHFISSDANPKLAAVAGNVKVGNQVNLLTKWQSIEYITSQNFDRMAYANINAITVVPGAIGAFRKSAIEKIDGFTTDTLAEDCDLTMRLLREGYVVANENKAIAVTEVPENTKQFIKQRSRWTFGVMQSFWKHRDTLFKKKYKGLGLWAIPNMLLFQFIIPTFSPLADILMILGLFVGNAERILFYYLIFMLIDASVSIAAFIFEKEKLKNLIWLIPQRFVYRWIMYVVLFKSYKKAIKGELQTWGILKRTGNVAEVVQ
ncbi:putative poly-beta-1,6 N-acetyl-D-glucosamine synthase [uncultured Paludibacter sp.]|uniref:Putative poly-beta-1,6 N-acetyl-D-glucosamine synthase n=1 Tax=uncultured Paludibacter sp. TaxID=497635 RepID=A0A653ACK8_9BACT|nr:putative poly-beta-1,6 N-acetyl-D-glucosamine synthase [uncultured Paludibacter sp.]